MSRRRPRVAVVGGGIAGLAAARTLARRAEVTLIDAAPEPGGHVHTVTVPTERGPLALDCGFVVFNRRRYPHFCRMLADLGVASKPTDMAFGVWSDDGSIAYSTSTLRSMYARGASVFSPRHHRLAFGIVRFLGRARRELARGSTRGRALGDFLDRIGATPDLRDHFVRPLAGALWSIGDRAIDEIPAELLLRFLDNHGMLRPVLPPRWRTVAAGASTYVRALRQQLPIEWRLGCAARAVHRAGRGVVVELETGASVEADRVILATHSDQSLALLVDAAPAEREALAPMRYANNVLVVHTDSRRLPRQRAARASWSYRLCEGGAVEVSYWLNRLQRIRSRTEYLVTVNPVTPIDPALVIDRVNMSHPCFDLDGLAARPALARLQGRAGTYFAGAYLGYGFHEDGYRSGLAAASRLLADWSVRGRHREAA